MNWPATSRPKRTMPQIKKLEQELYRLYARIAVVLESYTDENDGSIR